MDIRRVASIASIALGAIMIVAGIGTFVMVTAELNDQNITIPDDGCLGGWKVRGPFTAYCQADIIDQHARESTGGLTYAELAQDDPLRDVAMNASFLRASLYTSVVAYGVAAMAIAMGILFILIGLGMRDVQQRFAMVGVEGQVPGEVPRRVPTGAADDPVVTERAADDFAREGPDDRRDDQL